MDNRVTGFLLIILLLCGCGKSKSPQAEVYQRKRQNIIKIDKNAIIDINTEIAYGNTEFFSIDNYIIFREAIPSYKHAFHLYDKKSYKYITSAGILGKGPGEVTRPGKIAINHFTKDIWVSDYGKKVIWRFPLDSVLSNSNYLPKEKLPFNEDLFMVDPFFVDDSTIIGRAAKIIDYNSFEMLTAKLNIKTNTTTPFGYQHPVVKGKHFSTSIFGLSLNDSIYVVAHFNVDFLSICNLDGNIVKNIYGPMWAESSRDTEGRISFFCSNIHIYKNQILIPYIGGKSIIYDINKQPRGNSPSVFLVFDLNGNYIKTIDIGYKFSFSYIDQENGRLIICFHDRESTLGYINLESIL
jgi:hypothetical protein